MLMKRCIQNQWLSKFEDIFPSWVLHCLLFSDLGPYQQPSREALSTLQDVTIAGVGE